MEISKDNSFDDLLKKSQELYEQENFSEALESIKELIEKEPDNEAAHQLMLNCIEKTSSEISQEDFATLLNSTMQIQEKDNPELKDVHTRLSLEYSQIYKKVEEFFITLNSEKEESLFQELRQESDMSCLALLNFMKNLKKLKDNEA